VKAHTRKHPHKMGAWSPDSKTHVSHMKSGDFRSNEKSMTIPAATTAKIEFVGADGKTTVLKEKVTLQAGEVLDATFMSVKALRTFLEEQIEDAKSKGVLFSLHMKATMMKVSDPKIFGHGVTVYYKDVFEKHGETFKKLGVDPDNGLGDVYAKIKSLPDEQRKAIEADIQAVYQKRPPMAMVNSDKGITNLHVPSDIIIDASMPPVIRDSGKMWGPDGKLADVKCVIPDSSYAPVYHEVVEFCKKNGAFDPKTMGTVPNVGLMAQAAEEYGSHDKTFKAPGNGTIRIVDAAGNTLHEHKVEAGDIWRACQVKDTPIQDWVKLAVTRARATGAPAVFWLDATRAHDAQVIDKVQRYLGEVRAGLAGTLVLQTWGSRTSLPVIPAGPVAVQVAEPTRVAPADLSTAPSGAVATPVEVSELATALATGLVVGQENPLPNIFNLKLYEVQKFVMLTGHMQSVLSVFVNEKVWAGIPEADRKIIADTMFEVGQKTLAWDKDTFDKYRRDLEGKGMTFVTEKEGLDVEAFRKAVLGQINKDFPEWANYITQIQAVK